VYLFSERTELLEHCAFICHLRVVAVFDHHQVDFTMHMEKHFNHCCIYFM